MDASELLGCFEQALPISVVAESREFALIGEQNAQNVHRQSFKDHLDNSKSVHGRLMLEASCDIGHMVFELWSMVFAKLKKMRLRATCWMSALGMVLLCGASTVLLMY